MKLEKLLKNLTYTLVCGDIEKEINSLEDNSKKCNAGCLFFAINGTRFNGEEYIIEAIKNGAHAIVCENVPLENSQLFDVAIVKVESVRIAMSIISKNFYCPKGYGFKIIGITGTNGKTTTSFMIGNCLQLQKNNVCIIGTSGIFINGRQLRGEGLTTPDPIELQSLFAFCNQIGVDYVVMEVSAHALELDKVCSICFDYAIFSNLTEDHLDFFKDMNRYGLAKQKLFDKSYSKLAIINISDNYGRNIAIERKTHYITYGECDCEFKIIQKSNNCFNLIYNNKSHKIKLNIEGLYNFYNATSAIVVLLKEGVHIKCIKKYFKNLPEISGRFNEFQINGHGRVVVDFAHTPDGLEKLLTSVRKKMNNCGRLYSVFGCGGNRDKAKRSIMGEVSGRLSDYTFISIDNPRFEKEEVVMRDIEAGIKKVTNNYRVVMPRFDAILQAINISGSDDYVVISGKGSEPYYEVNGKKEFYREDVVVECIKNRLEMKINEFSNQRNI